MIFIYNEKKTVKFYTLKSLGSVLGTSLEQKVEFQNVIDVLTTFELLAQYFKWCPLAVLSHLL